MVIHYPVFGGPHNQALRLHRSFAAAGWTQLVLLPDEPGNAASRLTAEGVPVVQYRLGRLRASRSPGAHLRLLRNLRRDVKMLRGVIRSSRVDLVVIGGLANPQAAVAAYLEDVPVVWQLLDSRIPRVPTALLMLLVRSLATVVMTTGEAIADSHPGSRKTGRRLVTFHPPVDTELFAPGSDRKAQARKTLRMPEDALVVGTIANLNAMKGHERFIDAASSLATHRPGVKFLILGASYPDRPGYAGLLLARARAGGLVPGRDLLIVDPGARVVDLAAAMDIFWLSSESRSEGIPTVIGEAMALGIPVVARAVGAVPEVLNDGCGILVESDIPAALADATLPLIDDPALRADLGTLARSYALNHYATERSAAAHLRAFHLALRQGSANPA